LKFLTVPTISLPKIFKVIWSLIFILKSDAILLSMEINNSSLSFFVHHSPCVWGVIIQPNNNSSWAIEGDRRISWYDNPQTANSITQGEWWTKNDSEELFISIDSKIASDFRIKINDQITLNILGREIVGTVKNFNKLIFTFLSAIYYF
jgi:hypothetical protein